MGQQVSAEDRRFGFEVPITPRVKQRPRLTRRGRAYTPEATKVYEAAVRDAYVRAGGPMYTCPVSVFMELHDDHAWVEVVPQKVVRPSKLRGDVDNLAKAIGDGLQGAAYEDDRIVVGIFAWKA